MIGLVLAVRHGRLTVIKDALEAAGAGATISIYGTARPATGAAAGGSPLVTFTLPTNVGSVTGGKLIFAKPANALASAAGSAVWARGTDASGAAVIDLSVGAVGSAAEVWIDSVSVSAGREIEFVSGELTEGNP